MTLIRQFAALLFAASILAGSIATAAEAPPAPEPATATPATPATTSPLVVNPPTTQLSLPTPATSTSPVLAMKPAEPALRIGYADLLKIGSESVPGKAAEVKFKAKADKYKKQINDKEKQLEKQKKAIESKLPTMSPEERASKGKEFDKKVDEYRKFVQKAQKEMEPLQQELSLTIYNLMEAAARELGRSKGLIAIVPKKELLYLSDTVESVDVTDDLLKLLNEREKTIK